MAAVQPSDSAEKPEQLPLWAYRVDVAAAGAAATTGNDEKPLSAKDVQPLPFCRFLGEMIAMWIVAFIPPILLYGLVPFQTPNLGSVSASDFFVNIRDNAVYLFFNYPMGTTVRPFAASPMQHAAQMSLRCDPLIGSSSMCVCAPR
jgi:hypothetical protein